MRVIQGSQPLKPMPSIRKCCSRGDCSVDFFHGEQKAEVQENREGEAFAPKEILSAKEAESPRGQGARFAGEHSPGCCAGESGTVRGRSGPVERRRRGFRKRRGTRGGRPGI